jgi:hypothetical protein
MQRVAFLFLAALVALTVPLWAAENPVGTWVGITEVPDQGADEVTLTIAKSNGGYTGTMTDSLGMVAREALRDIAFAEGVLTIGFALTDGTAMKMTLKVTGDKMVGEWRHPEGDVGAITLERKPAK